jgi:hypothetical protein
MKRVDVTNSSLRSTPSGIFPLRMALWPPATECSSPDAYTSERASLEIAQWPPSALPSNNRFERSVMHKAPDARYRVYLLPLCQPRP